MPKLRNLTGEIFGKLTALERTEQKEDRYYVWRCRCTCGNEILVSTKKLLRGTVQNCGCSAGARRSRGAPPEDISGQKFGKLTAVRQVESVKRRTMWLCKCDCGNEKIAEKQALKSGRVKSCGCIRSLTPGIPYKDLSGKTFGRLTALHPTEKRDSKGSVFWKCKCACGNETEVSEDSLTSGNTVSCGCRKQEVQGNIQNSLTFVDGTCIDYLRSRKSRSDNKSGFRGVFKIGNRYRVNIGFQGKRYYLGLYDSFEEAVDVRLEAEKELHGNYIRLYDWWNKKAEADPVWAKENPMVFDVDIQNCEICVSSPLLPQLQKDSAEMTE